MLGNSGIMTWDWPLLRDVVFSLPRQTSSSPLQSKFAPVKGQSSRINLMNEVGVSGEGGELSPKWKGSLGGPNVILGVSVRVGIKVDTLTVDIAGDFVFDEGKEKPWLASSGSINGGCGVSVLGEAILGLATDKGDLGVIVSVTGSTSIKATGTITG